MTTQELTEVFGEPIFTYTRAQAIADGELVDVSKEAGPEGMMGGFTIPVALTRSVWEDIEDMPADGIEDVRGRLHDVLWMARCAACNSPRSSQVRFYVHMTRPYSPKGHLHSYKLLIHPGDNAEPVATIMQPEEN